MTEPCCFVANEVKVSSQSSYRLFNDILMCGYKLPFNTTQSYPKVSASDPKTVAETGGRIIISPINIEGKTKYTVQYIIS